MLDTLQLLLFNGIFSKLRIKKTELTKNQNGKIKQIQFLKKLEEILIILTIR
jgi:hypothetical protein